MPPLPGVQVRYIRACVATWRGDLVLWRFKDYVSERYSVALATVATVCGALIGQRCAILVGRGGAI
jgi:hypothetical protein